MGNKPTTPKPQLLTAVFYCWCCPPSPVQENASNPQEGWRAKDCAVYLVMAVTVKGRTGERGATTTNRLVNVGDFFTQQVRWHTHVVNKAWEAQQSRDGLGVWACLCTCVSNIQREGWSF